MSGRLIKMELDGNIGNQKLMIYSAVLGLWDCVVLRSLNNILPST